MRIRTLKIQNKQIYKKWILEIEKYVMQEQEKKQNQSFIIWKHEKKKKINIMIQMNQAKAFQRVKDSEYLQSTRAPWNSLNVLELLFFFKVAKNTLEIDNFVENHWILIKILEKVKYVLEIWQQWRCDTWSLSNKYIACAYVQWSECSRQQSVLGVIKPGM